MNWLKESPIRDETHSISMGIGDNRRASSDNGFFSY